MAQVSQEHYLGLVGGSGLMHVLQATLKCHLYR